MERPAEKLTGKLILEDGSIYEGEVFGAENSVAGEVVFNTGMTGYPESLSDPSYTGQILVCTYPLIGNYGIAGRKEPDDIIYESDRVHISGLVVGDYSRQFNHWEARQSLAEWMNAGGVPGLSGIDTRALTRKLREKGTLLGKLEINRPAEYYDPNTENLIARVSIREPRTYGSGARVVVLIDCGCKFSIIRNLVKRGLKVRRVPWNYDLAGEDFQGLVVSNGPGNPKMCRQTILQIRQVLTRGVPVFGICLGHQLLALAAGANTYKLKYGHRSQNQPVQEIGTHRCLVTSQNHGYAVDTATLPQELRSWFVNLNDQSNEGIRHVSAPFRSVQFHPEAAPGPVDAEFLFDEFAGMLQAT